MVGVSQSLKNTVCQRKFWVLWAPDLVEVIVRGNATAQTGGIWKTGTTACSSLAVSFLETKIMT